MSLSEMLYVDAFLEANSWEPILFCRGFATFVAFCWKQLYKTVLS